MRWWHLWRSAEGRSWAGWPYFLGFGGAPARRVAAYASEVGRQLLYFGVPIVFLAWTDAAYTLSDVEARGYLAQLTPSVAKSHDDLGVALTRTGDLDGAIAAHRKAIETDPGFARAHTHLGIAHSRKGDRGRAVEYHRQAIAIDPELPQAHFNLGVDCVGLGRFDAARTAFERAIALDDQYVRAYLALSDMHRRRGDWAQAREYQALALATDQRARRQALGRNALPWTTGTQLNEH
jgi:tetratricopeptide (TPR) repeat protein